MDQNAAGTTDALRQAHAALQAVDPGQPDTIAAAGLLVEDLVGELPSDAPRIPLVLSLTLEVLQRLYEGQASSPEAELSCSLRALLAAAEWAEAGHAPAAGQELHEAGHGLWCVVGNDPQLSPFAVASTLREPPSVRLQSLDDVVALLIGLGPDDRPDLAEVLAALQSLSAAPAWPAAATQPASTAVQFLRRLLDGATDDPSGTIEAAVAAIGECCALLAEAPEQPLSTPPSPAADDELVCLAFTGDADLLAEFVTESLDHLQAAETGLLDIEANPADREALHAVFRGFHTIKGTAGFLGLPHIQRLAHHAEALLDRARDGEVTLTGAAADAALRAVDVLKTMIVDLRETPVGGAAPLPADFAAVLVALTGAADDAPNPATGPAASPAPAPAQRNAPPRQDDHDNAEAVRVRTDRLDALINLVGELVIANAMLLQDEVARHHQAADLGRKVSQVSKITRELQAVSTSMRMVPLKHTFQKMARVVRDLGQKAGKQVHFATEGEDTEIDRTMVEALGDPLLHMVRNAVDHGLEPAELRAAAGKEPTGQITLRAYHAAGSVVLELQDDGRGLDAERILAKALATGVVDEGRELSDADIYRLVFTPGLSTAKKVTDVSGRGVGMDVVARNIEALHGRVEISSTPGQGTTFSICVPLTLAIMDGMLVRVGEERYIIPTINIQQAFRADAETVHTVTGRGEMVLFRGELVPVVRLHRLFQVRGAVEEISAALLVLTANQHGHGALLVDELLGQQQIVIKPLGKGLGQLPGLSGSAILGDGRVGLILDVNGVLAAAQDSNESALTGARLEAA